MNARIVERALWLGTALALLACGALALSSRGADGPPAPPPLPALGAPVARASADALAEATDIATAGDLFRAERGPASAPPPAPPIGGAGPTGRPRLLLRGLLGGPPWDAVIDGIPGRESGTVLRVGQTLSGLTVRAIRHDTVFVRGMDTTWTLTLGRSW